MGNRPGVDRVNLKNRAVGVAVCEDIAPQVKVKNLHTGGERYCNLLICKVVGGNTQGGIVRRPKDTIIQNGELVLCTERIVV